MAACIPERLLAAAAALAAMLLVLLMPRAAAAVDSEPALQPFSARYAIYRNGKLTGKVDVELVQKGAVWSLHSEGSGTHGLARLLAARDSEEVSGLLRNGHYLPDSYRRHTRVASIDDRWAIEFDWEQNLARVIHDEEEDEALSFTMDGIALDPLSLKLEMRRRLSLDDPDLRFRMVEEDEIEEMSFRVLPREWLETSLGCLLTIPLEKVRHNSTRYTRVWHAPDLDHVEVRVEHGKTGGSHLEMRITALTLGGEDIAARPGCAAMQSGNGSSGS